MNRGRRTLVTAAAAGVAGLAVGPGAGASPRPVPELFPKGFLWGAATAAHQVEGNNLNSDAWLLENVRPTVFREPSGDAANSFELWPHDLDLVRRLGLNAYRFSIEWARIEPEEGRFSVAMLDHYRAMVEGCRHRGLTPVVTFNHFTTPRWFAARGGWTNLRAPDLFARFCERAARGLGPEIGYATTLNEPNVSAVLAATTPEIAGLAPAFHAMAAAAARAAGAERFGGGFVSFGEEAKAAQPVMIAAHHAGREAIKAVRPDLPVGVSLAIADEEAAGATTRRDEVRAAAYGPWLEAASGDDFVGVQNYERRLWDAAGRRPAPPGSRLNYAGAEVYPPSLAGAARYAHEACGRPVLVTEHGVGTNDDTLRAELIPAALTALRGVMDKGVPVIGYMHWSLIDNFEWIFGYGPKFGLCAVDRATFRRTPKPSAAILGAIARRNAV